jgi:uncharacterized protein HemY
MKKQEQPTAKTGRKNSKQQEQPKLAVTTAPETAPETATVETAEVLVAEVLETAPETATAVVATEQEQQQPNFVTAEDINSLFATLKQEHNSERAIIRTLCSLTTETANKLKQLIGLKTNSNSNERERARQIIRRFYPYLLKNRISDENVEFIPAYISKTGKPTKYSNNVDAIRDAYLNMLSIWKQVQTTADQQPSDLFTYFESETGTAETLKVQQTLDVEKRYNSNGTEKTEQEQEHEKQIQDEKKQAKNLAITLGYLSTLKGNNVDEINAVTVVISMLKKQQEQSK